MTEPTPTPDTSRTIKVVWAPTAIQEAVDRATAILQAAENDVFAFPGGHLFMQDLACLIDAGRQYLTDDTRCTCESTYATYDGPQRDCPEHGAAARSVAGSPTPEVGRCGNAMPRVLKGTRPDFCRLPAGHAGWHRGDDGGEWSRDWNQPPAGVLVEQVLDQMARLIAAVDGIVMDSEADRERHSRLLDTFREYERKARAIAAGSGTAALTDDQVEAGARASGLSCPCENDPYNGCDGAWCRP